MIFNKKTSKEIKYVLDSCEATGTYHEGFPDKVWVSQESLIKILEKERHTPFRGTEASDDISSQIIEDIWKELKR